LSPEEKKKKNKYKRLKSKYKLISFDYKELIKETEKVIVVQCKYSLMPTFVNKKFIAKINRVSKKITIPMTLYRYLFYDHEQFYE